MRFIMVALYILQFIYSALPDLIDFIQKLVKEAKKLIDELSDKGAPQEEIDSAKADARERIVRSAKEQFDVPESIMRIALEAEVYRTKAQQKEPASQVEMAKKTYPHLFGEA